MGESKRRRQLLAELETHFRCSFENRRCFAGPIDGACANIPINSHTLAQRWLRTIARDGHVYYPKLSFINAEADDPFSFALTGIKRASAFPLFCSEHDNLLFQPVETRSFAPAARSAALLHFRAVCREMYAKVSVNVVNDTVRPEFDGTPEGLQLAEEFVAMANGQRLGLMDMARQYFPQLDDALSNETSRIRYYVAQFGSALPVAFTGAFFPEYSFQGEKLVDYDKADIGDECLGVCCFSDGGKAYAVLTWNKGSHFCAKFALSFHRVATAHKADAAIALGFEHIENIAIDPNWWESLTAENRTEWEERSRKHARDASVFVLPETRASTVEFESFYTNDGVILLSA